MKLRKRPTLKEKRRYIVFKIYSEMPIRFENMQNAVFNVLQNWLGEEDLARAKIKIIKNLWRPKEQIGFLRCVHVYVDLVKVSLALVHQIGESPVVFQTLLVSGTIKSAKRKLKI